MMIIVFFELKRLWPVNFIQIQKHSLLDFTLSIVDGNWIIMLVKATSKGNNTWLSQMTNVGGSLSRLLPSHHGLRINRSERIDHNFTFNWLNWINNDTDSFWIKLLLWFLSTNICSWKPATESRMRMVPSYTNLISSNLFHHIHEICLINWINRLNTNSCSSLRHGENINYSNCVVVMNFTNH